MHALPALKAGLLQLGGRGCLRGEYKVDVFFFFLRLLLEKTLQSTPEDTKGTKASPT